MHLNFCSCLQYGKSILDFGGLDHSLKNWKYFSVFHDQCTFVSFHLTGFNRMVVYVCITGHYPVNNGGCKPQNILVISSDELWLEYRHKWHIMNHKSKKKLKNAYKPNRLHLAILTNMCVVWWWTEDVSHAWSEYKCTAKWNLLIYNLNAACFGQGEKERIRCP